MKKPDQPFKSTKFSYYHAFKDKIIISKTYIHPDRFDDYDDDDDDDDDDDENNSSNISSLKEEWWYDTSVFSLQEIIDSIPAGTDLKQVIISIHRDRQIDRVTVNASIREPVDKIAWQAGHDAEEKDYQIRLKKYEADLAEYEEWKTKEEIKNLQNKLASIKK